MVFNYNESPFKTIKNVCFLNIHPTALHNAFDLCLSNKKEVQKQGENTRSGKFSS